MLTESDFTATSTSHLHHRQALINASKPPMITVFEHLQNQGKARRRWGPAYLNSLAQYVPSASQHPALCRDRSRACHPAQAGHGQRRNLHQCLQPAGPHRGSASWTRPRPRSLPLAKRDRAPKLGLQSLDTLVIDLLDKVQEMADNPVDGDRHSHRLCRPGPHDQRPCRG